VKGKGKATCMELTYVELDSWFKSSIFGNGVCVQTTKSHPSYVTITFMACASPC
jgi:hypothetical protein